MHIGGSHGGADGMRGTPDDEGHSGQWVETTAHRAPLTPCVAREHT